VDREQVARGDWLLAPGSLRTSPILDVRFELLGDHPKAIARSTRVRFHLGAAETLGRLVLLDVEIVAPGGSALAQLRLEAPVVAARGDRFVIRSYSPSRTIGGGAVIEPVAGKRRRGQVGLESLVVHESGSLEARLIERLRELDRPTATAVLARAVGESEAAVLASLAQLRSGREAVTPTEGRWIAPARWESARETIGREVAAYAAKHPGRYGVMKGELKSGLKGAMEGSLFDAAFDALASDGVLVQRGERVRPAGPEWTPPAELMTALERAEGELEGAGYSVPEAVALAAKLGADGPEALSLGYFLGRLVRVSGEYTYTTRQLDALRASLARHFTGAETLSVAAFKELTGASRKWAVPLLEHCDRHGWTIRMGDERKRGARLG
jgi:selenocysteine-specific elongation factor